MKKGSKRKKLDKKQRGQPLTRDTLKKKTDNLLNSLQRMAYSHR